MLGLLCVRIAYDHTMTFREAYQKQKRTSTLA